MNKRTITCSVLMTILLIVSLEIYLSLFVKEHYISRMRSDLLTKAVILKDMLPDKRNIDSFCKTYKEKTGARITVISETGQVLGDSDELSSKMENHLNRPEIKEAVLSGTGSSIRFSNTLKKDFIYVAILAEHPSHGRNPEKFFLRLSMPLDRIKSDISRIRMPIIISTLLVLVGVFFIWFQRSKRLRREVMEIIEFTDRIAHGNFSKRLFLTDEGELRRLAGHVLHMAEELQARLEEVKNEKQTVENVLKNMKEGLLIMDKNGRVLLINDSLKDLLGLNHAYRDLTATEILRDAELLSLLEGSRLVNETISREISFKGEKDLLVTSSPVELSGNERGIVMTFHNITRLKRLEQIRRDFVANVAHEIKTPITAIKGFAETLIDGAIEDKENAIKFLEIIKRHSERLNSLVNDLLTLSSIEQGEIKLKIEDINLSELIDSLFTLIQEKAKAKGLYIKKVIPDEITFIRADRDRLFQILLNLIDNAIKFTDLGGVTVGAEKEEERIILFIEDTGCGIERKHLPRLGERFYRVDRARSRELGGTGLGLAIVKHLVRAHGWTMEIDSIPGTGTKVKIFVPSKPAS